MPTYEYECTHCGFVFDVFQNINDKRIEHCPKCKKKVKRLIGSGSGFIFKGSGFYATDYKKKECPMSESGGSKNSSKNSSKDSSAPAAPACAGGGCCAGCK